MSTVIPFRRGEPRHDKTEAEASRSAAAEHAKQAMKLAGFGVLGVLRYTVFLVLLFLRRPIRFLLTLCGSGGLLGLFLIAVGFSGPNKGELLGLAGGMAAVGMFGSWFYDVLLLRLSPEPIILT
jgi:hypothetical protein